MKLYELIKDIAKTDLENIEITGVTSDNRKQVSSDVPAGIDANGVSRWGMKGPMPHISGRYSAIKVRSSASSLLV